MDFKLFKEELFKEAQNSGFEECEIYYADSENLSLNIYEGEVEKYFTGIPTPLGAILLWVVYLIYLTDYVNEYFVLGSIIIIGYLLNSKIKIKHL